MCDLLILEVISVDIGVLFPSCFIPIVAVHCVIEYIFNLRVYIYVYTHTHYIIREMKVGKVRNEG